MYLIRIPAMHKNLYALIANAPGNDVLVANADNQEAGSRAASSRTAPRVVLDRWA